MPPPTPQDAKYVDQLAHRADPDELWRLPVLEQLKLPHAKRLQLDTAVALRRYAAHLRALASLHGTGKSLLVTPLNERATAVATASVKTPAAHRRLLQHRDPA